MTQAELARTTGVSRTTMNLLENGLFPDIGVRKAQAILEALGLDLQVRPAPRPRKPDYVRMACASASTSYREKLSEIELMRGLLTGRIPPRRRPHFRMLLDEAPVALLKGLADEVGMYVQPGRVVRNLSVIAASLGSLDRHRNWLEEG